MIFYFQSSEGASSGEQLGQITLPQFRGIMQAAKVITTRFPAEKVKRFLVDFCFESLLRCEIKILNKLVSNEHAYGSGG